MLHIANDVIFGFIFHCAFFSVWFQPSPSIWYHSYCLPFFAFSLISFAFCLSFTPYLYVLCLSVYQPCLCEKCMNFLSMAHHFTLFMVFFVGCYFACVLSPFISSLLWLLLLFNFQLFVGVLRFHLFAIEIFMRSAFCVHWTPWIVRSHCKCVLFRYHNRFVAFAIHFTLCRQKDIVHIRWGNPIYVSTWYFSGDSSIYSDTIHSGILICLQSF